jgi:type IV pilus assembly protein PilB
MTKQEELLKYLVENNFIEFEQLKKLVRESQSENKSIEDMLLARKVVSNEEMVRIKAKVYGLEYADLSEMDIPEDVLNVISENVAENYQVICFGKEEKVINVGLVDPENFKAIEAVDFLAKESGFRVQYHLISEHSFKIAFAKYKPIGKELSSALKVKAEEESMLELKAEEDEAGGNLEEITKGAPVAKIVSVIIRHAVEGGASDIHIEPMKDESRVRYRIDGVLHTSLVLPINIHNAIIARIKVMSRLKLDETRIPQDGRIRMMVDNRPIDFRISILPLVGTEKAVLRILDTTGGAPKLESLGYKGVQLKKIKDSLGKTGGLILITGPTGSGKSTTLFSILDMLNKDGVNISTLEDPVEYQIKGVNQSQIRPEVGYTFVSGLRSFLRQDPDIIMVGEIRDEETAELAIHASLTGHLVLSTLHTNSAPGAITRMVDMGLEPFLLGTTLNIVIAQRLVRKICPDCKEKIDLPENYLEDVKKTIDQIGVDYLKEHIKDFDENNLEFYRGKGCSHCGNVGYAGRLAISEVLVLEDDLEKKVISGETNLGLEDIKATQSYVTIKQDGVMRVLEGLTTFEEVMRVMED